jgi:hypothetical protein
MTAYLAYRLERAAVGPLHRVWLLDTDRGWLAADLGAELTRLSPDVDLSVSPLPAEVGCDLAVIPFDRTTRDPGWRRKVVRAVARSRPRFIGLYEISKRRLVVVDGGSITGWLFRLLLESLILRWQALVAHVRNRASSLVQSWRGEP